MNDEEIWEKFESNLLNQGITKNRIKKLVAMFNSVTRGLDKDLNDVTRADIEVLVNKLHRNKFRKIDGKEYSGTTKSDIKKFMKQFWKWFKGDNEFYPKEVSWIKTRISKDEKPDEKPIITIPELNTLANTFDRTILRVLVLLLFDSGFRIQEMLSIKKRDLLWEEYDDTQKCFWLFCNESKTEKRKVPIPLFTEDVKEFCNTSFYLNLKDRDHIFQISYPYFLRTIGKNSKKVLGKKITPHALRHSSATFYAKEFDGNMNLLADRYGWSYSSNELKTYIRRSGAYQKQGAKKVFSNEILKIKEENKELKDKIAKVDEVMNKLVKNPKILDLLAEEGSK